jgi:hypothetical protein
MTAIKPPDGRSGPGSVAPGSSGSSGATGPDGAERTTFRDALEQAEGAGKTAAEQTSSAGASQGGTAPDAISELARAVRSGALPPDQAVERLVDRALAGVADKLSEAQRLELTAVLRQALENDPALGELRKAIR